MPHPETKGGVIRSSIERSRTSFPPTPDRSSEASQRRVIQYPLSIPPRDRRYTSVLCCIYNNSIWARRLGSSSPHKKEDTVENPIQRQIARVNPDRMRSRRVHNGARSARWSIRHGNHLEKHAQHRGKEKQKQKRAFPDMPIQ